MKSLIILLLACLGPSLVQAQWISIGGGQSEILALGVHDTSLYQGVIPTMGSEPILDRFHPWPTFPYWRYGDASGGIDRSYGNISSFASYGRYFFACMTDATTGSGTLTWRSGNNAASWDKVCDGFICSSGPYVFCSEWDGTYRSADSGARGTFHKIAAFSERCMVSIGSILVANAYGPLWRSTDTGNSWTQITSPETELKNFTPINGILYAIGQHLLRSPDSGLTWSVVPTSFTPQTICTDGTHLFVGANDGLYIEDSGGTWRETGLAKTNVNIMCVFDSLLWAESWVTGQFHQPYYTLYYRPLSEIVKAAQGAVPPTASAAESITLYPNPSTGFVSIAAGEEIASIDVTNILGVSVLSQTAVRSTSATLDLSHLPAGSYFIRITTANRTEMRRVVRE